MADEKKTMHSGWLETRDGELFAPKTIIDNVTARNGKSYDSVIKEYISSVQGGNENSIATIERDIDALYEKIKNFDGTDSDTFYIIDSFSNIIARIDASGIHSVEVEAQGYKLTEMGKKLDYINTDDLTEFFIMDNSGNIIMRVDNNGITSVDFHSRNGSLNDVATRMTAVEMDIDAKFKNLDTSDSNEFVVRDSAGNIIARIDANGVTSVNFDTPTTISYTELVALVNSNNLTNNAAVENLKAYVDGRLKNFNGDDAEIFYIVDNNDPKNAIFKVDASGATSINFTTKEADLNTVANDLKTEIKAREDAVNAEETARIEKDKLIDTAIGQLQQTDADFTTKLQYVDFSDANTFYVIDKNNCIITRIDNEGTHSIDFIAYRNIEDGKESISLWALKDKVDENHTSIITALDDTKKELKAVIETNEANIAKNANDITKLNANSTTEGSVAYQIAQVVAGAPASYDTLKEIADWIGNDTSGAASMANDISNIKKWINEDLDAKGYTDKQAEQDNLIANLQGSSVEASTQLEGSGKLAGENGASTKIEIKHSEVGPANGYTKNASTNNSTTSINGSAQTGTIKIPQITVNKYGHVTSAGTESVEIKMPDLGPLETITGQLTSDLQFVDFADSDAIYIGDNVTDAKFENGSWKPENLIAKINKDGITSVDFIALNTNKDTSISLLGLQEKVDNNQEAINDSLDTAVLNLTGKIDNNYATFTGRKVNIGTDGQLTGGGALANNVTIGHAEMNNDANYKLTATTNVSGSAATTTVSIPNITVNKYGHVTNIEDKTFKITMPDLAPLENDHAAIEVEITGQDATATSAKISNNKVIIDDLTLKTVNTTTGSYGATTGKTLNHTDSFDVPYFTVNGKGLVTKSGKVTYTLPSVAELENTLAGIKAQVTGGDATSNEITISNNKLAISDLTLKTVNSNTGTYGMTSDQSPDFESSIKVPYFTVNGKGLITSAGHKTLTIPSLDPVNENIADLSTQLAAIEERFSYMDGDDTFYIVDGSNNIIARFDASGLTTTNVILHKEGIDNSIDFQQNAVFFESTGSTMTINNI